jgi:hypothetical protein
MASSGDTNLPPVSALTGLDGMFAKTNIVLLILFGFCCGQIALILGIVGLVACKDPRAKQNAMVVTIIAAVEWVLAVVGYVTMGR